MKRSRIVNVIESESENSDNEHINKIRKIFNKHKRNSSIYEERNEVSTDEEWYPSLENKRKKKRKKKEKKETPPFPLEIWFMIFDFILSGNNILKNRLVCHFWNSYISINLYKLKTKKPDRASVCFPNLKQLIILENRLLDKRYLKNLEEIKFVKVESNIRFSHLNIKKIIFEARAFSFMCISNFLLEVRNTKSLESITVCNLQRHCTNCISSYGRLHHLKEINIYGLQTLTLSLVREILNLQNIERVAFINCVKYPQFDFPWNLVDKNKIKSLTISKNLINNVKEMLKYSDIVHLV